MSTFVLTVVRENSKYETTPKITSIVEATTLLTSSLRENGDSIVKAFIYKRDLDPASGIFKDEKLLEYRKSVPKN